jgi:uncharacterized membrane protein
MIGMNWGIVGPIIAYLMMLLILSLQPYINARMVLFGVFVPEESRDHEKVRSLKKRYVITIWLVSIATAAIIMSISQVISAEITVSILILIVLQHVTTLIVMWIFRKTALRLKKEQNWQAPPNVKRVASLSFPRWNSTISNVWFLFHLLIITVCAVCASISWDSIPSTLVTHYGLDGIANGFSNKSFGSVFSLNLIQLGMLALFIFVNQSIRMSKQSLDPNNPEQSMGKQIKFRKIMSVFLWGMSLIIIAFMGVIQGSILYEWSSKPVITAAIVLPILLLALTLGLSFYLSRKKLGQQSDATMQNDNYWKMGVFYVNSEDPALFVSKRTGIGWTLNFGHPMSWIIFIGIIAIPIAISIIDR